MLVITRTGRSKTAALSSMTINITGVGTSDLFECRMKDSLARRNETSKDLVHLNINTLCIDLHCVWMWHFPVKISTKRVGEAEKFTHACVI